MHGVFVAFFVDGEFDGLAALDARDGFAFFVAALYGCDIAQVDRSVGNVRHDGTTKLLDTLKLIERSHQEALIAFLEATTGQVDVFRANSSGNLLDADAELRQLLLVDPNLNFVLEAAADFYGRRTLLCLEFCLDAVFSKPAQET